MRSRYYLNEQRYLEYYLMLTVRVLSKEFFLSPFFLYIELFCNVIVNKMNRDNYFYSSFLLRMLSTIALNVMIYCMLIVWNVNYRIWCNTTSLLTLAKKMNETTGHFFCWFSVMKLRPFHKCDFCKRKKKRI